MDYLLIYVHMQYSFRILLCIFRILPGVVMFVSIGIKQMRYKIFYLSDRKINRYFAVTVHCYVLCTCDTEQAIFKHLLRY